MLSETILNEPIHQFLNGQKVKHDSQDILPGQSHHEKASNQHHKGSP